MSYSICPTLVQCNASFVVNMENVKNPLNLRADDNGVWVHNGVHTLWLAVRKSRKFEIPSRGPKPAMHINSSAKLYYMKKSYHYLKTSPDFRRLIVTISR